MDNEIREKIRNIFIKHFNLSTESFDFGKNRSEFENWDSLAHLQLVSDIEDIFKINFEMDEISEISKPEDLLVLVVKKENAQF
ncbi:MAG: acyl carrier protein [Candidatus Shapirobacteria bacterium]|jgi:acyl carrier protein